ncbi:hypothetical protein MN116_003652 [Schistosoma mekongi]|uniref:Uncharacterized protein n=1 Tax=Schistosoma mekongi TaxID=38744 RepID=A0AAE1ZFA4_SCHME|nr:hypothetical protein MN116_003652 [Schistosoma mekongi]
MDDNLDNDSIRTEDYASKFNEAIDITETQRTNSHQPVQSYCGEVKKSSGSITLLPTWCTLLKKTSNVNNSHENSLHLNNNSNNKQIILTKISNNSVLQQYSTDENKTFKEKYHTNSLIPDGIHSVIPSSLINDKNKEYFQSNCQTNEYNLSYRNNSHLVNKQPLKGSYQLDNNIVRHDRSEVYNESKLLPVTCDNVTNITPSVNNLDQSLNKKSDLNTNHYYPPYRNRLPCEIRQNEQFLDRSITTRSFSLKGRYDQSKVENHQPKDCIQISDVTLNTEEILAIINERDELYEILRANEEEASARYSTEKRLMSMKQEFTAEQQRLRQIITALEEELEVTMCRLNQLTAERSKWTTELDETKNERNEIKEKLKNVEENHKIEMMELENKYEERIKQIKLDEIKNSEFITKEIELKMQNSIKEQMKQTYDLEEKLQKLNKSIKEIEEEKENLRHENMEIIKKHREKERLIRNECEEMLENKSIEKGKEISKLMDIHSVQLNELVEQMQKEKIQAINDIRSCYTENIQELQNKLLLKQTEIQTLNESLTNTQNLLHESRNQEILEKLKVQTVEAQSKELAEWEKEKLELWKIKMNELKNEKDSFIDTIKQELQEQKNLAKFYHDQIKTIQKEFDTSQSELERKIISLENQIETLKMKHEMDMNETQQIYNQKISNMELQHSREMQQAIENENVNVQKQANDKNQVEKDKILENLITSSTQISSKLDNLINDICHSIEWNVENLYSLSDCELDLDKPVVLNKETKLLNITNKWSIDNISIEGVMESLTKHVDELLTNLRANSTYILTQLQQRKDVFLTQIKNELNDAHDAVKRVQQQAECEQNEYKVTIKQYRTRIEELENDATRATIIEQLKYKDEEIGCLKNEIQQLKQQITKQTIERNESNHKEHKDVSSIHQLLYSLNNNENGTNNLVIQQPIRIITELKARIQRLREENMALRRLLLRRPLVPAKQSDQESEQRPISHPLLLGDRLSLLHLNSEEGSPASETHLLVPQP